MARDARVLSLQKLMPEWSPTRREIMQSTPLARRLVKRVKKTKGRIPLKVPSPKPFHRNWCQDGGHREWVGGGGGGGGGRC